MAPTHLELAIAGGLSRHCYDSARKNFPIISNLYTSYFHNVSTLAEIESAVETLLLVQQEELLKSLTVKLGRARADRIPIWGDHLRSLDERFAAYGDNPAQASAWEEVRRRFAVCRV